MGTYHYIKVSKGIFKILENITCQCKEYQCQELLEKYSVKSTQKILVDFSSQIFII